MLIRFDPFRELDRELGRWTSQLTGARPAAMPIDAYRHEERFVVHFDLPGVDASTIDLTVEKNVLTVRAERRWQPTEGQEVLVAERSHGTFTRQLFLGESLDIDHIDASYDNGVLTVTIPVAEAAKPRKVEVTAASAPAQAITAESRAA